MNRSRMKAAAWCGGGGVCSLLVVGAVAALPALATSVQQSAVSVKVQASCSLEAENNNHSEIITPNTYSEKIGGDDTIFTTYCNDINGYVIYAVGVDDDGTEGNTNLRGPQGVNIETGTAVNGAVSNWAFKLSEPSSGLTIMNGFDNYSKIPEARTVVAKRVSGTSVPGKDSFKATYAAFIAGTQTPGTYVGKVRYLLFHPSDHNATNQTINDLHYMQDFASLDSSEKDALVATMETNHQYELTDIRDNRTYFIAKLADGNVWMTENLDFDIEGGKTYTSETTDLLAGTEWTPKDSTHTDTVWNSTSEAGKPGVIDPQSYDPGNKCWVPTQTWTIGDHFVAVSRNCDEHDTSHYHIGNYYNYSAAVAQDNTSATTENKQGYDTSICPAGWQLPEVEGDKSFINLQNAVKSTDKPWASGYIGTPTSGQEKLSESTIHADPYYLPYSGYWRGTSAAFGFDANYRTGAVSSAISSYTLDFNGNNYLNPQRSGAWRLDGFSVRCVAR